MRIQLDDASDKRLGGGQGTRAQLGFCLVQPFEHLPGIDRCPDAVEGVHRALTVRIEEDGLLGGLERFFQLSRRQRALGMAEVFFDLFGTTPCQLFSKRCAAR